MPQVAAALAAMDLRTHHAIAAIRGGLDRTRLWLMEAWPTGSAFKFRVCDEQRLITPCADKCALALFIEQRAGACPFCGVATQHAVLLGGEDLPPLVVGVTDFELV